MPNILHIISPTGKATQAEMNGQTVTIYLHSFPADLQPASSQALTSVQPAGVQSSTMVMLVTIEGL